jgi:hypothetical protein
MCVRNIESRIRILDYDERFRFTGRRGFVMCSSDWNRKLEGLIPGSMMLRD